ncbi:MAG: CDP-alcohol phosphatidyltransferase family protein [Myxococcales bacterium]|nr:CDP-alcohol phosphatidyltransferase family protein [Myxococcales bacterium]
MTALRDIYFTYALGGICTAAALAYAIRLATGAAAHSDRVERIGGTVLLGKGVMNWTYWATDPIVRALVALHITANALTWSSLVLGAGAGVALAGGWFGLACLLATFSTIGDILDGQIARATRTGSDRGELLDAAVDRYTEYAFAAGLVIYFRSSVPLMLVTLAALLACVMVSYASAKAEALQITAPRGLMRRHERATYLIVGAGLTSLFGEHLATTWPDLPRATPELIALVAVAVIGNLAAILRFVRISRALP